MIRKLYHGCYASNADEIMNDIKLGRRGFFMTPDINIAKGYGSTVLCFEAGDFESHVGTIDKSGDAQADYASGIEYVLKTERHLVSFYKALEDVYTV